MIELRSYKWWQKSRQYNDKSRCEVDAFYWTVLTPDIVNLGREEQGSVSV